MSIQGIGSGYGAPTYQPLAARTGGAATPPVASPQSPASTASVDAGIEQQFLDYLKKTPAQRMVEAWLKAHHLTQKDLDAMPADKRNAILKQMADDIKTEMKRQADAKAKAGINILA